MIEVTVTRPFICPAGVGRKGQSMRLPESLARSLATAGLVELPPELVGQTTPETKSRRKRKSDGDAPAGEGSPPDRG